MTFKVLLTSDLSGICIIIVLFTVYCMSFAYAWKHVDIDSYYTVIYRPGMVHCFAEFTRQQKPVLVDAVHTFKNCYLPDIVAIFG